MSHIVLDHTQYKSQSSIYKPRAKHNHDSKIKIALTGDFVL